MNICAESSQRLCTKIHTSATWPAMFVEMAHRVFISRQPRAPNIKNRGFFSTPPVQGQRRHFTPAITIDREVRYGLESQFVFLLVYGRIHHKKRTGLLIKFAWCPNRIAWRKGPAMLPLGIAWSVNQSSIGWPIQLPELAFGCIS